MPSWGTLVLGAIAAAYMTDHLAATVLFLTIGPALGIDSADDLPAIVG